MITDEPGAAVRPPRPRARSREGVHADLVVFDPETIGSEHATLVHDLPGDTPRLTAGSHGVVRVFVNGVETVTDNAATGALPGSVLRSGHDTATVLPDPSPSPSLLVNPRRRGFHRRTEGWASLEAGAHVPDDVDDVLPGESAAGSPGANRTFRSAPVYGNGPKRS